MSGQQIAGMALIIVALAGTQLPKIDLSSGRQGVVPVAPIVPESPKPLALKLAERWPPPERPRSVCRQGLCAARQGAVITIGSTPKVAQQRLQRVQKQLAAEGSSGAKR